MLRRHCDELGRDYDAIRKTILWFGDPVGDPDGFVRDMEQYAGLGVSLATFMPQAEDPAAWTSEPGGAGAAARQRAVTGPVFSDPVVGGRQPPVARS
ncbi:hypothetical protein [Nocardioides convexus]|uniref:hypothetical protein n=1 Tax=Nocardioides convexus TaxID=2712224 RepID=UPI0024183F44|nr:hypothetical protein [Nocardioides convexus]